MFVAQRLHPWGEEVESWYGKILSLPFSSTEQGFVLISEKQSNRPWCLRTVSINKRLASLTILSSHLKKSWPKSLGLKGHIKITTQPKSKGLLRKKITQGHKLIWWPWWFVDARESFSSNLQSLQLFFLMNEVHPSFYPEASTKPEKTFEYWRYKNNNQD